MTSSGNRFGFDFVTTLVGSGLTLLLSAGIMAYGDELRWTVTQLYAIGGSVLLVGGVLLGLIVVAAGLK